MRPSPHRPRLLRLALTGVIPLTGTSNLAHMLEDIACFDFELSEAEMTTIESIAG